MKTERLVVVVFVVVLVAGLAVLFFALRGDPGIKEFSEEEKVRLSEANEEIANSSGVIYEKFYEIVEEQDAFDEIYSLCEQENTVHCYKWASHKIQNFATGFVRD